MRNMELKIGLYNGGFGAERFVASLLASLTLRSLNRCVSAGASPRPSGNCLISFGNLFYPKSVI